MGARHLPFLHDGQVVVFGGKGEGNLLAYAADTGVFVRELGSPGQTIPCGAGSA